jgi:hypothetical protein
MANTPTTQATDIVVVTPDITLAFSRDDGGLRVLRRSNGPNVLGHGEMRPSVDAATSEKGWLASQTMARYLSHSLDQRDGAWELGIDIGLGPLIIRDRYTITGTLIARRATVRNVGVDELRLVGLRLSLPWVRIDQLASCHFEAPGASVRPHVPLAVAAEQRRDVLPRRFFAPGLRAGRAIEPAPTFTSGLMAIHNEDAGETLLCWYASQADIALPQIEGNGTAVLLEHEIAIADLLGEDVVLSAGTQSILLTRDPWPQALGAFRRTWRIQVPAIPPQPPEWVHDASLYEVHARQAGGWEGLTDAIPQLKALGIDTICLLPIWHFGGDPHAAHDGSARSSADVFALRDLERIDPQLGEPEALSELVAAAHSRRMRMLVDLPLLGCVLESRHIYEQPAWFCRDALGHLMTVPEHPSIIAFNWADASLREYVAERAIELVERYGFDGLRVIAPRAAVPNWAERQPHYASAGHLAYTRMLETLAERMRAISPDAVLIGDVAGPIGGRYLHGIVDELVHHMFVHTALGRITPAELREWLSDHSAAQIDQVPRISFTESHRTRMINPLADGLRGSRISRMILCGMVFAGFIPSIWAGQEEDEQATIMLLLHAWQERAVLRRGERLWDAAPCNSPQVWSIVRRCGAEHAIGLMNVSALRQTVTVSVPIDLIDLADGSYGLRDLLTHKLWREAGRSAWKREELLTLRLTLEPFEAYCFAIEPVPA